MQSTSEVIVGQGIIPFETKGRHANAKFLSSREEISQPGIELPTFSLRFGYLSTIIQQLTQVITNQLGHHSTWQTSACRKPPCVGHVSIHYKSDTIDYDHHTHNIAFLEGLVNGEINDYFTNKMWDMTGSTYVKDIFSKELF